MLLDALSKTSSCMCGALMRSSIYYTSVRRSTREMDQMHKIPLRQRPKRCFVLYTERLCMGTECGTISIAARLIHGIKLHAVCMTCMSHDAWHAHLAHANHSLLIHRLVRSATRASAGAQRLFQRSATIRTGCSGIAEHLCMGHSRVALPQDGCAQSGRHSVKAFLARAYLSTAEMQCRKQRQLTHSGCARAEL